MLSIRALPLALKLAVLPLAGVLLAVLASTGSETAPRAVTTVEMKDMTWEDVRGVIAGGATTVIVPTGGIEQNGPHMVLAKHDHIVGHAAKRIASELGRTVVACFTGVQMVSAVLAARADLYDELRGFWRVIIAAAAADERAESLQSLVLDSFAGPQPALVE